MREVAAIVEPAIDMQKLARLIDAESIHIRDATAKAERLGHSLRETHDDIARHCIEQGRLLIAARRNWKSRGPTAKGWGEWLAQRGINDRTALDHMHRAGYDDKVSATENGVAETHPTSRQVAAARKQEKDDEAIVVKAETQPDIPAPTPPIEAAPVLDIDARSSEARILSSLLHTLGVVSREWPTEPQRLIAELRRYADKLERRLKDSV